MENVLNSDKPDAYISPRAFGMKLTLNKQKIRDIQESTYAELNTQSRHPQQRTSLMQDPGMAGKQSARGVPHYSKTERSYNRKRAKVYDDIMQTRTNLCTHRKQCYLGDLNTANPGNNLPPRRLNSQGGARSKNFLVDGGLVMAEVVG